MANLLPQPSEPFLLPFLLMVPQSLSPPLDIVAAVLSVFQGPLDLSAYDKWVRDSWVSDELYWVRNIRPGFHWGLLLGEGSRRPDETSAGLSHGPEPLRPLRSHQRRH